MIEQFLQTALEFIKEIWFQLDSRFDLENTEAFKLLKPYLIQLQDNPLYMGISLAALFLVPYALIKARSISRERERKLDELMEEMEEEEEYDEDDPRRLRRPEAETSTETDDDAEKPLFENESDDSPSFMDALNEMEEDDSKKLELEVDPSHSESDEASTPEDNAEPVSSQLTENDFEKDLNEFMSDDEEKEFDDIDDSVHDQAIKELQEDGELIELEETLSKTDPFDHYSELDDDEQDKAIKDLQEEMERTINQLSEQIEEPAEPHSSMKDLSQIHIGGDTTIDDEYNSKEEFYVDDVTLDTKNEAPPVQEESTTAAELSDSDILASLEPELENINEEPVSELEPELEMEPESDPVPESELEFEIESEAEAEIKFEEEPIEAPKTGDYEPEIPGFTFEEESGTAEVEPEVSGFSFEEEPMSFEESPEPTRTSPLGETDSLIDRLKFLQTRFENRYQPTEHSPEPAPAPIEKSITAKDYANFTEPRRYSSAPASPAPDSKKYMELLESFVFMKDQKKHK